MTCALSAKSRGVTGRGALRSAKQTAMNEGTIVKSAHTVPLAHPALAGHFPGRPIVPGVVILDYVGDALRAFLPELVHITGFPVVKFLVPLPPEQTFEIAISRKGEGQASFEVTAAGNKIVSGTISYRIRD